MKHECSKYLQNGKVMKTYTFQNMIQHLSSLGDSNTVSVLTQIDVIQIFLIIWFQHIFYYLDNKTLYLQCVCAKSG